MNKKVRQAVEARANGKCELTGEYHPNLELHHILGGRGKRKKLERVETCIMITPRLHNHQNTVLMQLLKHKLQSYYFQQGHTEAEARALMGGKLYLKDGEIVKGETAEWLL
jgi:hypothetical protein